MTIQVYDEKSCKWLYVFVKQNNDSLEFVLSENVLDYEIPDSKPGTSMDIILQEFRDWQNYHNHAASVRCYDSFAKLADIRNQYNVTAPLAHRGLPGEISSDYENKIYSGKNRTHFTIDELKTLDRSDMPYYFFTGHVYFEDYQFDESQFENWNTNRTHLSKDENLIIFSQDDIANKKREDLYEIAMNNKHVYLECSGKYQRDSFIDYLIQRGDRIQEVYSMPVRYILGFSS